MNCGFTCTVFIVLPVSVLFYWVNCTRTFKCRTTFLKCLCWCKVSPRQTRQHTPNCYWIWKANSIYRNSEAQWPWEQQLAKRRTCQNQYSLNITTRDWQLALIPLQLTSHIDQSQLWWTSCLPLALTTVPRHHFDFEPTCKAAKHTAGGPPSSPVPGLKTDAEKQVCDRCLVTEMNSGQLGIQDWKCQN